MLQLRRIFGIHQLEPSNVSLAFSYISFENYFFKLSMQGNKLYEVISIQLLINLFYYFLYLNIKLY